MRFAVRNGVDPGVAPPMVTSSIRKSPGESLALIRPIVNSRPRNSAPRDSASDLSDLPLMVIDPRSSVNSETSNAATTATSTARTRRAQRRTGGGSVGNGRDSTGAALSGMTASKTVSCAVAGVASLTL